MRFYHHEFVFEVSDDWWAEAGMNSYRPKGPSYHADLQAVSGQPAYEVRIDEVAPLERKLSHGVFNDDIENGLTAKDRVLKILRGFVANEAIPPVEVVKLLPASASYLYKLTNEHIVSIYLLLRVLRMCPLWMALISTQIFKLLKCRPSGAPPFLHAYPALRLRLRSPQTGLTS
jgi:hypothetical protein